MPLLPAEPLMPSPDHGPERRGAGQRPTTKHQCLPSAEPLSHNYLHKIPENRRAGVLSTRTTEATAQCSTGRLGDRFPLQVDSRYPPT